MAFIEAPRLPEGASLDQPLLLDQLYHAERGPELTIVVPTRNERDNIIPLYKVLAAALGETNWEMMIVDDDSQDGTPDVVRWLGQHDRRVRLLHRIGRRGLSSACVEGIQASTAPYVAVMDADLQHDEKLLPRMLETLKTEPLDVVVGSRYVEDGGVGDWDAGRVRISDIASRLGRAILKVPVADPMSGFFMLRRDAFQGTVRKLSELGFKILVDLFASAPTPLRAKELPYEFRNRHSGESKFDTFIGVEYLMLLADKLIGHIVPVRFLMFVGVGAVGVLVHLALLSAFFESGLSFAGAQTVATLGAMICNFVLNNVLTYRDRRLTGWRFVRGLLTFCLICSVGAVGNIGIATLLFSEDRALWWVAGLAGAAMGAVWNYAVNSVLTWRAA